MHLVDFNQSSFREINRSLLSIGSRICERHSGACPILACVASVSVQLTFCFTAFLRAQTGARANQAIKQGVVGRLTGHIGIVQEDSFRTGPGSLAEWKDSSQGQGWACPRSNGQVNHTHAKKGKSTMLRRHCKT